MGLWSYGIDAESDPLQVFELALELFIEGRTVGDYRQLDWKLAQFVKELRDVRIHHGFPPAGEFDGGYSSFIHLFGEPHCQVFGESGFFSHPLGGFIELHAVVLPIYISVATKFAGMGAECFKVYLNVFRGEHLALLDHLYAFRLVQRLPGAIVIAILPDIR